MVSNHIDPNVLVAHGGAARDRRLRRGAAPRGRPAWRSAWPSGTSSTRSPWSPSSAPSTATPRMRTTGPRIQQPRAAVLDLGRARPPPARLQEEIGRRPRVPGRTSIVIPMRGNLEAVIDWVEARGRTPPPSWSSSGSGRTGPSTHCCACCRRSRSPRRTSPRVGRELSAAQNAGVALSSGERLVLSIALRRCRRRDPAEAGRRARRSRSRWPSP